MLSAYQATGFFWGDHQKDYAEDHKCTVMATRVG